MTQPFCFVSGNTQTNSDVFKIWNTDIPFQGHLAPKRLPPSFTWACFRMLAHANPHSTPSWERSQCRYALPALSNSAFACSCHPWKAETFNRARKPTKRLSGNLPSVPNAVWLRASASWPAWFTGIRAWQARSTISWVDPSTIAEAKEHRHSRCIRSPPGKTS